MDLRRWFVPLSTLLALLGFALVGPLSLLAAESPGQPLVSGKPIVQTTPQSPDVIELQPSPDGEWEAVLNKTAGSLGVTDKHGKACYVFPTGSGVTGVSWSPDSTRLLAVRPYYEFDQQHTTLLNAAQPIEIWQVRLLDQRVEPPSLLYHASREEFERDGAQQVVFGKWSPNSRFVVMWVGMLSASILADGLPPFVLDTDTGQAHPIAMDSSGGQSALELSADTVALTHPRYHSWSPDGSRLAMTVGGYRSAQINKWLNLVEAETGRVTTLVSKTEQIPGIVAWSPNGDAIAYAAVPAEQTGDEWADWMTFDNPAIAGRRVYMLDSATGQHWRLNGVESYQDAPVWSSDGSRLYYVQRDGDFLNLMAADPTSGQASPVPGVKQPVDLGDPARSAVGYYGQFGREQLLEQIPGR